MSDHSQLKDSNWLNKVRQQKLWLVVAAVTAAIAMSLVLGYWFVARIGNDEMTTLPGVPSPADQQLVERRLEQNSSVPVVELSPTEAYYHHLTVASQLHALGRFDEAQSEIRLAEETGISPDGHFYMVRAEWYSLQNDAEKAKNDYFSAKRVMSTTADDYRVDDQTIDMMIASLE